MIRLLLINISVLMSFILGLMLSSSVNAQVKVILDTDMASDCDDVGALAVLNVLADMGEAEILGVVVNRKDPTGASAAAVDVVNTYYGRPNILIGTDKDGAKIEQKKGSAYTLKLKNEFENDTPFDSQMPDALEIYRKTLASQPDSSVIICSIGALSNLEDLIRSKPDKYSKLSGLDLIKRKVKSTIIMGGGFPRTPLPETNIYLDPASAVTVTNEWPGPIVWQGAEVGWAIITGEELKNTNKDNPVRRAYELRPFRGQTAIDQGKPSHDQAAVLLAVRGIDPRYWNISDNGYVVIDSEGETEWKQKQGQNHQYVSIKVHPKKLEKLIGTLMSTPPKN